jgi:hypothetical protein
VRGGLDWSAERSPHRGILTPAKIERSWEHGALSG